jgi:hypothetical protein
MDSNLNMVKDPDERKVYFEFSDYSTSYVFFEKVPPCHEGWPVRRLRLYSRDPVGRPRGIS